MKMFDIYMHEFELDGQQYKLVPVSGKYLGLFYSIASVMEGKEGEEAKELLSESNISKLHLLALETFKASYPNEPVEKLDRFVSQNLMRLIEHVFKVNTSQSQA